MHSDTRYGPSSIVPPQRIIQTEPMPRHFGSDVMHVRELASNVSGMVATLAQAVTGRCPMPEPSPVNLASEQNAKPCLGDLLMFAVRELEQAKIILEMLHKEVTCG